MSKKIIFILFLGFHLIDLWGQEPIKGNVKDRESKSIKGAVIVLTDTLQEKILAVTETDSLGNFLFSSVPPTNCLLDISAIGYENQLLSIDLFRSDSLAVILEKIISYELETVDVKAKRPQLKRRNGKFMIDHVFLSPFAKGVSSLTFLKFVPLVHVNSNGELSILNRSNATVYINGRNSNMSAEAVAGMLRGIPANDIERIEVIPTPGSAYSSAEKNGIINIIIRKRPDEGIRATVTLQDGQSNYNSQYISAFLGYSGKKINLTWGANGSHSRSRHEMVQYYRFDDTKQSRGIHEISKGSGYMFGSYLNMDYRVNNQQVLGLRLTWSGNDFHNEQKTATDFKEIGKDDPDSTYYSFYRKRFPTINQSLGANLNYDLKTDDQGSMLKMDLTFRRKIAGYRTQSLAEKQNIPVEDFIMRPDNKLNVGMFKSVYRHCFNADQILESGISITGGRADNHYFFGNREGEEYVSELGRTNHFLLKDYTFAAYLSYESTWSEQWETTIGLRFETYSARGTQKVTSEKIRRNDPYFLPSFSVTYIPSDDHELAVDAAWSTRLPPYSQLNPFQEYLSPALLKVNNPYLKPVKSLDVMFSYTMFDDYMFVVDYMRDKDAWTEFTLPAGQGLAKKMNVNYGTDHTLDFALSASKDLWNGYFHLIAEVTATYTKIKGKAENIQLNIEDMAYAFSLKTDVILSKKRKWSFWGQYKWNSAEDWAMGTIGKHQSLEFSLVKRYKNSSLTLSGYNFFFDGARVHMKTPAYEYSSRILHKRPIIEAAYTYTFGNRKIKKVGSRNESEMMKRLD